MSKRAGGAGKAKTTSNSGVNTNTSHNASQEPSEEMMKALFVRAAKRLFRKQEKERKIEELKNQGNEKFKQGLYEEAVELYSEAVEVYGAKALLNSNLAAAYLKLEWFGNAEEAATAALIYEPKNIKARFRRGMARKGLGDLKAALADFETIMLEDPSCHEAAVQAEIVSQELMDEEDEDDYDFYGDDSSTDNDWPGYDEETDNSSSDESDSSDCNHLGNGVSCRFYNHDGCNKGTDCRFSHAPDKKSVRDNLGKNVCIYFLFDRCTFGTKCIYSHSKTCLSHGWWDHEDYVQRAQVLLESFDRHDDIDMQDFLNALEAMSRAHDGRTHARFSKEDKGKSKAAAPTPASSKPAVLLLALENDGMFHQSNEDLYDSLCANSRLVEVISTEDALQRLASSEISAVFVPDAAITKRKNAKVLTKLVEFAKSGGSVVVGGNFSSFVRPTDLNAFFHNAWGLPWKGGSYHRTAFSLNQTHLLAKNNPSLPKSFSIKALHVKDITPGVALYSPTNDSKLQSMVWAPEKITNLSESPIAHTKLGKGYFGYIGDVNGEEGSIKATLAMLGLLNPPSMPPQASTSQLKDAQRSQNSGPVNGKKAKNAEPGLGKSAPKPSPVGTKNTPKPSPAEPKAAPAPTQEKAIPRTGPSQPTRKPTNPFVLILSLENEDFFESMYKHLLTTLKEKVEWKQALTAPVAMMMLASPDLVGVFVTDPGIVRERNAHVVVKLVDFVKNGGSTVIGGLFSTFANMEDINSFFANAWGLRWKSGSYHRTNFTRNPAHDTIKNNPSLESTYSMKALYVGGVDSSHPIYLPIPEHTVGFSRGGIEPITDHTESPAVQAQIGKGYLGYLGDVNAEVESTNLVLAMLGLLDTFGNEAKATAAPTTAETNTPQVPLKKPSRPFMMVVSFGGQSFFTEVQADLLCKLRTKLEVLQGLSNERVVDLITSPDLVGILITDAAIMDPDNAYLLARLVEYTKAGGTVVAGGSFSRLTPPYIAAFFGAWGLSWKSGDNTRTEVTINRTHDFSKNHPSLPASFTVKALHLSGITPSMAVYVASKQSHIHAPLQKVTQATIVYTKVGEGYIGYLGDVGVEESSLKSHTTIVLAMFGLDRT